MENDTNPKSQAPNPKQTPIFNVQNRRVFRILGVSDLGYWDLFRIQGLGFRISGLSGWLCPMASGVWDLEIGICDFRLARLGGIMIEDKIQLVPGFSWFGKNIGIKDDSLDFGGILADRPCDAAGVFTRNTMPGAPVIVGREHLQDGQLQAVIVNSKNANVATGLRGVEDSRRICRLVSESCGIKPDMVLPSSTGVIGRRLPIDVIAGDARRSRVNSGTPRPTSIALHEAS